MRRAPGPRTTAPRRGRWTGEHRSIAHGDSGKDHAAPSLMASAKEPDSYRRFCEVAPPARHPDQDLRSYSAGVGRNRGPAAWAKEPAATLRAVSRGGAGALARPGSRARANPARRTRLLGTVTRCHADSSVFAITPPGLSRGCPISSSRTPVESRSFRKITPHKSGVLETLRRNVERPPAWSARPA